MLESGRIGSIGVLVFESITPTLHRSPPSQFPQKKTPPPSAEGLSGEDKLGLLRCDSGEHVILSPLDEQKDIVLVFRLL